MEYDAQAPDEYIDDIEDDGKPLFEKHLDRRSEPLYLEAVCSVRLHLRRYSILLVFISCLPIFYSIIFCQSIELGVHGIFLTNPMFNKYETNNECPSQKASFRNGIIALSVFYGVKIYKKLILSVLYLLLLFYYGCEVRDIRLRWSKDRSAVTRHELFMNYFELTIITIQTLSIFPFLVGGYFLIRHVYRKHTDAEIALVNEKFEDEQRILKKQKREARDYGIEVNDEKKELEEIEKEEEEKEKKEQEKLIRRLGRIERMEKDINEREQKRKNKEDKNRKLRAQKRRERRTVAAEMDEYEKEPDVNAFSVEMSSYGV